MRNWDPQADGPGDRALAKSIVTERPRRLYGLCTFCGWPTRGRACKAHAPLLALDPYEIAAKGRAA